MITTTPIANTENLAIFADYKSPLITLGEHPDWTNQFKSCINSTKTHKILSEKLARFKPFILIYSKIWPDIDWHIKEAGFENPLICIISGVGEHKMTPWMMAHNIGHTYLSNHQYVKNHIKELLGLDPIDYTVFKIQDKLVKTAASRDMTIPNLAEITYELFATWVWHGKTRSDYKEVADYCDDAFEKIMKQSRGEAVWHRYRPPMEMVESDCSALAQLIG